ncbi:MAG: hypothetical protein D9V47_04175 [Clostridia bacterium]|nr:MAG: hypothetical protein D9V47_04175 [Clostridia bacterium]
MSTGTAIKQVESLEAIGKLQRDPVTKQAALPEFLKPCVAALLTGSAGGYSVDDAAYLIVQELGRLGYEDDEIVNAVQTWNNKLACQGYSKKVMRLSDISGKVRYLRRNPGRQPACNSWR